MPYRYREDIAIADAAFDAWGESLEELFVAVCDAAVNVMIENLEDIEALKNFPLHLKSTNIEMLLFSLLEEIIFLKDAETLLLRVSNIDITHGESSVSLDAKVHGEKIDSGKHNLNVDVKAVTLHRFKVEQNTDGWNATVVLDI